MGWWCQEETREQFGGPFRSAGGSRSGKGSSWMEGISGGTAKPLLPPGGIWAWLSSRALLGADRPWGSLQLQAMVQGGGEDTGGQCLAWRTGKGSASPAARSPWEWTLKGPSGHLGSGGQVEGGAPAGGRTCRSTRAAVGSPRSSRVQLLLTG